MSKLYTKKHRIYIENLLAPMVLAIITFFAIQPNLLNAARNIAKVDGNEVIVTTEVAENGYTQIVYKKGDDITYITNTNYTNANPVASDDYVAWMRQVDSKWHIFLHYLPTSNTVRLTYTGNNVNPDLIDNKVAWEGFSDGNWNIYYFDGSKVSMVSDKTGPAQDVKIYDDLIVFSQKDTNKNVWNSYAYSTKDAKLVQIDQKTTNLDENESSRNPKVINNEVVVEVNDKQTNRKQTKSIKTKELEL